MMIRVRQNGHDYEEMHVDGGVTTSIFTAPLIFGIQSTLHEEMQGAHVYMIINGQLARVPHTTRYNTMDIISSALAAEMTYKTREAIIDNIAAAKISAMQFRLTAIPMDYPNSSFINFEPAHMHALFIYGRDCAVRGMAWTTPTQFSDQQTSSPQQHPPGVTACPGAGAGAGAEAESAGLPSPSALNLSKSPVPEL